MFLDTFYELVEKIELHDKIKAKKKLNFILRWIKEDGRIPSSF